MNSALNLNRFTYSNTDNFRDVKGIESESDITLLCSQEVEKAKYI